MTNMDNNNLSRQLNEDEHKRTLFTPINYLFYWLLPLVLSICFILMIVVVVLCEVIPNLEEEQREKWILSSVKIYQYIL